MKTWRVIAICWLLLALPLQGFAAVSQTLCHGNQQLSQATPVMTHVHTHAEHGHAEMQAHDLQHSTHLDPASQTPHKCNTCAQCCAGHVMAFFAPQPLHWAPAALVLAELPIAFSTNAPPRGLERPPRTSLA